MVSTPRRLLKCHHCGKLGHIKRQCRYLYSDEPKSKSRNEGKGTRQKVYKAAVNPVSDSNSSDENYALVACHALSANANSKWIVDSGATCHMCSDSELFQELKSLEKPVEVTFGDGHMLNATGRGTVSLKMKLPNCKTKECKLLDVLHVPKMSYNLLSVSKAAEAGKTTEFNRAGCQIFGASKKLIGSATRAGSLYFLDCDRCNEQANPVIEETKENIWHRRFGHLGLHNLQRLTRDKLVNGFDFNMSKEIGFCGTCAEGKHHRSPFPTSTSQAKVPLGLVHSDVCGKMNSRSLGGAEYFLTFIDYMTRCMS